MKRIAIFITLIPSLLFSQAAGLMPKIEEYVDSAQKVWGFQGTVLIAKHNTVIFEEAYGMANLEKNQPNTVTTKFLIGSITKSFTAIAIMQLVEKGILELDQPITLYLEAYPSETGNKITIRHLLSHTSGIPVYSMLADFQTKAMLLNLVKDVIALFKDEPLMFEPGSKQRYGSPGYLLLGVIIENVTGLTYQEYVRRYITEPSGMFGTDILKDYKTRPGFAKGYHRNPDGKFTIAEPLLFPIAFSAGALSSTAHDLYLLDRALNENSLLDPNSIDVMISSENGEYGCGFSIRNLGEHKVIGHDGSAPGYIATYQRWLDDSLYVVVLCNNASLPLPIFNIADALAAIILSEKYEMPILKSPLPVHITELSEYEGVYQEKNGTYYVIGLVGHRLANRNDAGIIKSILPESKDILYYEQDFLTTLTFLRNANGSISGLIQSSFLDERFAEKVNNPLADSIACDGAIITIPVTILKTFEGSYQFSPNAPDWNIFVKGNGLFAQAAELPAIELLPLSEKAFCIRSLGVKVVFNQEDNQTTGLTYIDQGVKHNACKVSGSN